MAQGIRRSTGGSDTAAERTAAKEREAEAAGVGNEPGETSAERHRLGKFLSPERRCIAVDHAQDKGMSERWACRHVRSVLRRTSRFAEHEARFILEVGLFLAPFNLLQQCLESESRYVAR